MRSASAVFAAGNVLRDLFSDALHGVVHGFRGPVYLFSNFSVGGPVQISVQHLGLQTGQLVFQRLLQGGQILLVDDDILGVPVAGVCRAKGSKVLVSQKEGWFEGNVIVQRGMLAACSRPNGGDDTAADTKVRKGFK